MFQHNKNRCELLSQVLFRNQVALPKKIYGILSLPASYCYH